MRILAIRGKKATIEYVQRIIRKQFAPSMSGLRGEHRCGTQYRPEAFSRDFFGCIKISHVNGLPHVAPQFMQLGEGGGMAGVERRVNEVHVDDSCA